jgi:hypothetical protein
MEPKGSLPHSQEPATCPYPELYTHILHKFLVLKRLCLYLSDDDLVEVEALIRAINDKRFFATDFTIFGLIVYNL